MLCIKTDLDDRNWLIYILEEFARINQADFRIVVTDISDPRDFKNTLYYAKNPSFNNAIINRSGILFGKNLKKISEDIFIVEDTDTQDREFLCGYDLFWNAFVFLSRLEEYLSEIEGRLIHSYSFKHPRKDKKTFSVPIVNNLFEELETIIKNAFPTLVFDSQKSRILELSHDVDYIEKTPQLRIKQTAGGIFEVFKVLLKPENFFKICAKTAGFLFTNPSYWCFDYWQELEKKFNQRSVFYIYANSGKRKNLKTWLLDPSYDLAKNTKLKEKLKLLLKEGFEVGLHGSFNSATDKELLEKEKQILEQAISHEVTKTRQHWLRYVEAITPYIHNELFKFDSTLGWNDLMGFRSGCACRYRPYDHKNRKAFDYFETPQLLMDSNIFGYSYEGCAQRAAIAAWLIEKSGHYKNSCVSISWHQRSCSPDYGWNTAYEKILVKWNWSN